MQTVVESMRHKYPVWASLLHSQFNLLFYGYGSKIPLLTDFADQALGSGYVVRIEGYKASPRGANGASILHRCLLGIFDFVFRHALAANDATLTELARKLAQLSQFHARTSEAPTRIYLVLKWGKPIVDNLERLVEYGGEEVLESLGSLVAASPTIHLIASVDHHRSALMGSALEQLAFVNVPVHTRIDYIKEVTEFNGKVLPTWAGLGGGFGDGGAAYGGAGLAMVLKSLTPNHLNLLKHLAILLVESSDGDGNKDWTAGIGFGDRIGAIRDAAEDRPSCGDTEEVSNDWSGDLPYAVVFGMGGRMFMCSASLVLLVFAASFLASPFYDLLNPRINWIALVVAVVVLAASFMGAIQLVLEKDDEDVACSARIHYIILIVIVALQLVIATLAQDYWTGGEVVVNSGGVASSVGQENILAEMREGYYSTWDRYSCRGGACLDDSCQSFSTISCTNTKVTTEFNRWISSGIPWNATCLSFSNTDVTNSWCLGKMGCLDWCLSNWQTIAIALWSAFGVFVAATFAVYWTIHPRKWHTITRGTFNRKDSGYFYYRRDATDDL
ncbi:Origin recognition complex subunit 2 [Perkinsus chesapeaki]|uniref:Origin recognition complex subunit 2 n=1 Tax=Perkinsus chesapeaki TaxID=330153 RepID=A0A7J6KXM3_PERCH|nr:Origin recognition complex subunit 2 [Perkinsus chesapeaki]